MFLETISSCRSKGDATVKLDTQNLVTSKYLLLTAKSKGTNSVVSGSILCRTVILWQVQLAFFSFLNIT
jgi:hypothetical protein